jgi:hypothetical protein
MVIAKPLDFDSETGLLSLKKIDISVFEKLGFLHYTVLDFNFIFVIFLVDEL